MAFIAIVVSMAMRLCLSVAITEMVVPLNQTAIRNSSAVCPVDSPRVIDRFHRQVVSKYFSANEQDS